MVLHNNKRWTLLLIVKIRMEYAKYTNQDVVIMQVDIEKTFGTI